MKKTEFLTNVACFVVGIFIYTYWAFLYVLFSGFALKLFWKENMTVKAILKRVKRNIFEILRTLFGYKTKEDLRDDLFRFEREIGEVLKRLRLNYSSDLKMQQRDKEEADRLHKKIWNIRKKIGLGPWTQKPSLLDWRM